LADALHWTPERPVDAVLLTDVVEHLEPAALDQLFARRIQIP
jgi:hypothetical protein